MWVTSPTQQKLAAGGFIVGCHSNAPFSNLPLCPAPQTQPGQERSWTGQATRACKLLRSISEVSGNVKKVTGDAKNLSHPFAMVHTNNQTNRAVPFQCSGRAARCNAAPRKLSWAGARGCSCGPEVLQNARQTCADCRSIYSTGSFYI